MRKVFTTVMLLSSVALSQTVFAADLEDDMKMLAMNYKTFNQTDNVDTAATALKNMRIAAVDAKQYSLKADPTENAPVSSALFDQVVAEIDKASILVQADQLDKAKAQAEKIAELKDQGHHYYRH